MTKKPYIVPILSRHSLQLRLQRYTQYILVSRNRLDKYSTYHGLILKDLKKVETRFYYL
jgi:hypothetical protein